MMLDCPPGHPSPPSDATGAGGAISSLGDQLDDGVDDALSRLTGLEGLATRLCYGGHGPRRTSLLSRGTEISPAHSASTATGLHGKGRDGGTQAGPKPGVSPKQ